MSPKAIIFYLAFLSQFFDPLGNHAVQFVILAFTSVAVSGLILAGYAIVASKARSVLTGKNAEANIGYASGGFYLSGSVLMASTR